MVPVVAPSGTEAVIWVEVLTVNTVAFVVLKVTTVAPVRLVPVINTESPIFPLLGLKLVMVGVVITVKLPLLVAVPPGVVTWMAPLVAPAGTVVVICASLTTVRTV